MFTFFKSIDCIIEPINGKGGLYLGNLTSAEDIKNLRKLNIKAVLTVLANTNLKYKPIDVSDHKIIQAEDDEEFDISVFFKEGIEFLEKTLEKTNVLTHCFAGISRSSSMVIAYIMKSKKLTFEKALREVRAKRSIVHPNLGFGKQLIAFEKVIKV